MEDEIDESYYYNIDGRLERHYYWGFIEFGMYSGKKVSEVMSIAPDYLEWCIIEIDKFFLDKYAENELKNTHKYHLSKKALNILKLKQKTADDIGVMESKCDSDSINYLTKQNHSPYDF